MSIAFAALPYKGGIDPVEGPSFYRIAGLEAGNRYTVTVTGDLGASLLLFQSGFDGTPACTAERSSATEGIPCKIVGQSSSIDVQVLPRGVHPGGRCFTLEVVLDSPAGAFEGAFDDLMTLRYGTPDLPHRGVVDHERSYYRVTQLTPGKRYTVWLTGLEDAVNLIVGTEDPEGGVRNVGCPLGETDASGTQVESCTVLASSDTIALEIWHWGRVISAQYVISVFEDPDSVGARGAPIVLDYGDGLEHLARVGPAQSLDEPGVSYYQIRGLAPGESYLASITDAGGLGLSAFTDIGFTSDLSCDNIDGRSHCALAAPGESVFLHVFNSGERGRWLTLNVQPAPVDEGGFSDPLPLSYPAGLPYRGSVAWTSEYLLYGLPAGPLQVTILDADGPLGFSAWATDSAVTDCGGKAATFPRCTLAASPAGELRVRASGYGHFDLHVAPAPALVSDYVREVGEQAIPNDDSVGLADVLTVAGSATAAIGAVTVELFVRHGRPMELTARLVAPDGTEVQLATKDGGPYEGVFFDDYALEPLSGLQRDGALTMLPTTPLHVLEGMNANGSWTLVVVDDEDPNIQNNDGTLLGWGLTFR